MKNKNLIMIIVLIQLSFTGYSQEFVIPDEVVKIVQERYKKDSLIFVDQLKKFMKSKPKKGKMEDAAIKLDSPVNYRWIKQNSDKIIQKIGDTYKTNTHIANLLSLTDVPDSIRTYLLNSRSWKRSARVGDPEAIDYYINEYISKRDENDDNWREESVMYWAEELLYLDSPKAWEMILMDMASTRIIRQCDLPDYDKLGDCIIAYRTYAYPILEALICKHRYELIFYRPYIYKFVFIAKKSTEKNPYIQEYFRLVEEFIKKEYGFYVRIQVPYLNASE